MEIKYQLTFKLEGVPMSIPITVTDVKQTVSRSPIKEHKDDDYNPESSEDDSEKKRRRHTETNGQSSDEGDKSSKQESDNSSDNESKNSSSDDSFEIEDDDSNSEAEEVDDSDNESSVRSLHYGPFSPGKIDVSLDGSNVIAATSQGRLVTWGITPGLWEKTNTTFPLWPSWKGRSPNEIGPINDCAFHPTDLDYIFFSTRKRVYQCYHKDSEISDEFLIDDWARTDHPSIAGLLCQFTVTRFAVSPNGKYIAVGEDTTGHIFVWSICPKECVVRFDENIGEITSLIFDASSTILIGGSVRGTVCVWDLAGHDLMFKHETKSIVTDMCRTPDTRVILLCTERQVMGFRLYMGQLLQKGPAMSSRIISIDACLADPSAYAVCTANGTIEVRHLADDTVQLSTIKKDARYLKFSRDGSKLAFSVCGPRLSRIGIYRNDWIWGPTDIGGDSIGFALPLTKRKVTEDNESNDGDSTTKKSKQV